MKKMIAPIIVTIFVLAVLFMYLSVIFFTSSQVTGLSSLFLVGTMIVLVILILTMIYVLIKRIKEIKEEDKDDLSKY